MLRPLGWLAVVAFGVSAAQRSASIYSSVVCGPSLNCTAHSQLKEDAVATATYVKSVEDVGWDSVHVVTSGKYPATVQAFAAGYAEGFAMQARIYDFFRNNYADWFDPQADIADGRHDGSLARYTRLELSLPSFGSRSSVR